MDQKLKEFVHLLCGKFDNSAQVSELRQGGNEDFPAAEHINTLCNEKISGLPDHFEGAFVLEESYYTVGGRTNTSPHLFLFTLVGEQVQLTSYDLPPEVDKKTLTYATLPELQYSALKPSEKFTPALYAYQDGAWEGGSVSMFSPVLKFTLFERFSADCLEVSETMEVNGKRTFGYDEPILYRRSAK
ncbi:MAG: hypothetical protein ACLU8W_13100 [Clostridia bacterium]